MMGRRAKVRGVSIVARRTNRRFEMREVIAT